MRLNAGSGTRSACLFFIVLSLAACGSSEPSQSDMLQAVKTSASMRQQIALAMMFTQPPQREADAEKSLNKLIEGLAIEKASCAEAQGAPGYVCDFRLGLPKPGGTIQYGSPAKSRFFKTGAGWSVEDPR